MLTKIEDCQIRGLDSRNLLCWKTDTSKKKNVDREETDKNSNNYSTRSQLARSVVQDWESRSKKEQQEWAIEKPKLENAGTLWVIYFFDPDGEEYKDLIKNGRNIGNINGWSYAMQKIHELTGNRSSEH